MRPSADLQGVLAFGSLDPSEGGWSDSCLAAAAGANSPSKRIGLTRA